MSRNSLLLPRLLLRLLQAQPALLLHLFKGPMLACGVLVQRPSGGLVKAGKRAWLLENSIYNIRAIRFGIEVGLTLDMNRNLPYSLLHRRGEMSAPNNNTVETSP